MHPKYYVGIINIQKIKKIVWIKLYRMTYSKKVYLFIMDVGYLSI